MPLSSRAMKRVEVGEAHNSARRALVGGGFEVDNCGTRRSIAAHSSAVTSVAT